MKVAGRFLCDDVRRRERARRSREPLWGLASFVLHAILFAAVVLFTPARSLVTGERRRSNPASHLSSESISSLDRKLTAARMREMLALLRRLRETRREMRRIREVMRADYDTLLGGCDAAALDGAPDPSETPVPVTIWEAFAAAAREECVSTGDYRDIRALEMAAKRGLALAEAMSLTDVARPAHIVDGLEELARPARTKDEFDRHKEIMIDVLRETSQMAETASAMLKEARSIMQIDGFSPEERLEKMRKSIEMRQALDAVASEDSEEKAKDLAGLMSAAEGGCVEPPVAAFVPAEIPSDGSLIVPGNTAAMSDAGVSVAVKAEWMYVNSWYVIGPFPNPDRVNLRRKFAPETIQDLDATYIGKDGRELRWVFTQAKNADIGCWWSPGVMSTSEVVPRNMEEFSIYYAYAEVFFDEDCDRWVAIGSDDRSDMWVNELPVWSSSSELKPWRQAEDFRRLHFRRGCNRILIRVENGPADCGWSVCISMKP
jgi:hypothetical protein